jgi:WhiB family transcriptional regulator, redox-sensing transcriptional regulator
LELIRKDYWEGALCAEVGSEFFFPERHETDMVRIAKRICDKCDIKQRCLDYALKEPELTGVWGGTTFQQRYKIRNRSGKWN